MEENMTTAGRKDDEGKLRFDLLPVEPLKKVVEIYTKGAIKYSDRNWEKGISYSRCFAALQRHSWEYWNGIDVDPEDGQHPLTSVVFYCLALMEFDKTHPELDDRPRQISHATNKYWVEKRKSGDDKGFRERLKVETIDEHQVD